MPASIEDSLSVLADVAGVPMHGLDEDQLNIVALRLVTEFADQAAITSIGRVVDEVRRSEGAAGQRVERDQPVRLTLIVSGITEEPST